MVKAESMFGTQMPLIRPTRADDEEGIRRFLSGLSVHTQTLRFFAGVGRPAAAVVRALIEVSDRRDALVAVREGEIIGHAMSYRGGVADVEIAVVVTDRWQGFGLGPELVSRLLLRATVRGATTVGMDVLGENRRALRMIRKIWPGAEMKVASGCVEVTAMIHQGEVFAEQGSGAAP
jgi:acetyltransferase